MCASNNVDLLCHIHHKRSFVASNKYNKYSNIYDFNEARGFANYNASYKI